MTVFSPNDISGLRRPKNVKFGTKVASSTRMIHALRLLEKVKKNCGKICKKNDHIILHTLAVKPKIVEMQKFCEDDA